MSTLEAGETSTAQHRKAFVVKALVKFCTKKKKMVTRQVIIVKSTLDLDNFKSELFNIEDFLESEGGTISSTITNITNMNICRGLTESLGQVILIIRR